MTTEQLDLETLTEEEINQLKKSRTRVGKAQKQATNASMALFIIMSVIVGVFTFSNPEPPRETVGIMANAQEIETIEEAPTIEPDQEQIQEASAEVKVEQSETVKQEIVLEPITNMYRDNLIRFVKSKNSYINAEEFVDGCLKTKLNCRLVIAMTGQESGFCNKYRLLKYGKWLTYSYDQIKDVTNKLSNNLIRYNCSGVKSRDGVGGNLQPMSDGFKGSIIGYDSWDDFFAHKETLTKRYPWLAQKATLETIREISKNYVGDSKVSENWSQAVWSFYNQI